MFMNGSDIHNVFSSVPQGGLHHAYCVIGDAKSAVSEITRFLEREFGLRAAGNPDFWIREYEMFGIDEAHALKEASERRAFVERKVFIVSAFVLTDEAQNALLKTFEEPAPKTYFFLILPTEEILFPTLRSRLQLIKLTGRQSVSLVDAALFLKSDLPKRLAMLKPLFLLEEGKRGEAESFTRTLECLFCERGNIAVFSSVDSNALFEILFVRKYIMDRSPSFKILLEHLALVLPRIM